MDFGNWIGVAAIAVPFLTGLLILLFKVNTSISTGFARVDERLKNMSGKMDAHTVRLNRHSERIEENAKGIAVLTGKVSK